MRKLPNWVLALGLAIAGCGSPVYGFTCPSSDCSGPGTGGTGGGDAGSTTGGGVTGANGDGGGSMGAGSMDGGSTSSGGADASGGSSGGDGGFTTVCTSGIVSHTYEGASMRPGEACVSCHASSGGEAQMLTIGGTVYPTAHEPNDCEGVNVTGASVVVTDANNHVLTLAVDAAGNFYSSAAIATPYTAQVTYGGKTLAMITPQTNGDCNACHTVSGANGAPGRVMLP